MRSTASVSGAQRGLAVGLAVCVVGSFAAIVQGAEAAPGDVQFVGNTSFESNVNGWYAPEKRTFLTQVSGGREGARAARVSNYLGSTQTIALNDATNTVRGTVAGGVYTAKAWVRVSRPGIVQLRVSEYANGATLAGRAAHRVTLPDTNWRQLQVAYTAKTRGAELDLNVVGESVPDGSFLYADGITLSGPPVSGTPTSAPVPTSTGTSAAGPAPSSNWRLKYSTKFTSLAGWSVHSNETQNNDNSVNLTKNVTAGADGLTIAGRRESGYARALTSGDVSGKGEQVVPNYFRAELRGKFRDEVGVWPALLWFRPANSSDGEIDVMEWMGGEWPEGKKRVNITMHNEYGSSHKQVMKPLVLSANPWFDRNAEHTYTVEKVPGSITVWVDGRKIASFSAADASWWNRIMENPARTWYPRMTLQLGAGSSVQIVPNPSSAWRSTSMNVRSLQLWTR